LIELMMTVSIAMILLTVAAPSFFNVINNNRLTVEANDLVVNLSLARSQAKVRKQRVVVCKSSNGKDCSTADTTNWEDGWLMYADDDQKTILRTSNGLPDNNTLRVDEVFSNWIAFLPDGRSIGSGSARPPTEGEFRLCDARGASAARVIQVSPIGRAKVVREHGATSCP
jgi:type IV fimbrial biogenesis protein FimT